MISMANTFTIQSVEIRDYRAIQSADVPLHPQLTMLIGDNATGKTTVLDAIATALWPLVGRYSSSSRYGVTVMESDFRSEEHAAFTGTHFRVPQMLIDLHTTMGRVGSHYFLDERYADKPTIKRDHERGPIDWLRDLIERDETAPILAYYRDNRGQLHGGRETFTRRPQRGRQAAYLAALGARVYFDEVVEWFEDAESAELRDQREHGRTFVDTRLASVRAAVESLVPQVSDLRMQGRPPQLTMTLATENQERRLLSVNQLSSGFRTMVALGMDLARRMADLNPHLPDPTQGPGIVLIDEIDLHLHPKWQQLVVNGLLNAFPNVQFVMTTHSPQVLTTLREENIRRLVWHDNTLTFEPVPSTEGAEAGRLLTSVMGVSERPPAEVSPFVAALEAYLVFLRAGEANTPKAQEILRHMQQISSDDPVLATLDLERRRLAARQG